MRVDERLRTSQSADVWAVGDCAGSPMFTHVGYDDFRVVLSDMTGGNRTTRDRLDPALPLHRSAELAHVGLHESEARAKKIPYRRCRSCRWQPSCGRAPCPQTRFMKALIGADDRILGFTAFGAEASELMAVMQTAMVAGMPAVHDGGAA